MSDPTSTPPSPPGSPVGELPGVPSSRPYRFTWDPSSRRKGPASVSETTEGKGGDYFGVSPKVDLFGVASTSLAQRDLPIEWSSSKHGFHAISTVLNNPHKKQAPPKAHSSLPSVPPADLPRVRRKDFDSYLRAVAPEWDRFERNNQIGKDGSAQLDGVRTSSDLPRPTPGRTIPSLNVVPLVFFENPFNLGDPRTFTLITQQREDEDPSSLSHSLPLLEKLSHYADTIEQHLVQEISLRSTSFFAALTNLHDLRSESEECLDRISKLRSLLLDVDEKSAKKGLEVVRQDGKLRNIGKVRNSVKEVGSVVEMTGVAKGLLGAGRWGEALGVIEEMDELWNAKSIPSAAPKNGRSNGSHSFLSPMLESPPPEERRPTISVPLSSLRAFANLPSHLRTLTMEIASSLTTELVHVLRVDLVERMNLGTGSGGGNADIDRTLRDRLKPLLEGLSRTKAMREATISWREVVLGQVRGTIKRHIPLFEIDDEDPMVANKSGGPGDYLRGMPHSEFMVLICIVYKSLLGCVQGLQTQNAIIVEVVESIQSTESAIDVSALQEELLDVLASAAELSNTRAAKVVGHRSEQHATLDLGSFLGFFNESWSFVVKCEVICRRMIVGLRGAVVSQAKSFLQTFHQVRISRSAKLVEDELWNPVEVAPALQRIADVLIDSAVHDAPDLLLSVEPCTPVPMPAPAPSSTSGNVSPPQSSSGSSTKINGSSSSSKHIRIEDRTYFTVSATADVLGLLVDYLKIIVNLAMLTTDAMSRVIEFLKAFNSRTCQVVLGAGAMRSAGLKNITAKHLALASQSLSIMIALVPYVRETFRRHLSPKQAVMLVEFDKLKRDYQEHQNEIHAKLIAIMGDRLSAHIRSLQVVKWDTPKSTPGVNDYMEILVKETVTLHKVLSRYLAVPIVEYVMTQVFAAMNHRLSEEYATIELPNQEAKDRLLADAKYLHQKFSALKNVGTPSAMLETVISEKPIARKPVPLNPKPAITSANERIKGLLSRKDSSNSSADKVIAVPASSAVNGTLSTRGMTTDSFIGTPPLGTPSRPSTPQVEPKPGFKQVAPPTSPELPKRPESPLPALPIPPDVGDVNVRTTDSKEFPPPVRPPPRTSSLEGKSVELDSRDGPVQSAGLDSSSPIVDS